MVHFKKIITIIIAFLLIVIFATHILFNTHVGLGEYDKWYEGLNTSPHEDDIKIQFAGVSTLLISDDSTHILTDGFFSRFSTAQMLLDSIQPNVDDIEWALKKMGIGELDAVLAVHSHFDHAMDSPEVTEQTKSILYGSESTEMIAKGWGLPESRFALLKDRQPLFFGKFKVTPIVTNHFEFPEGFMRKKAMEEGLVIEQPLTPPAKAADYKMGEVYTFLFEHPKGSFLLQSSAGWKSGTLDGIEVDHVIMGVGGLGTQTEEYQASYFNEIVNKVKAQNVYLIHWDAFSGSIRKPIQGPSRLLNWLGGKTQKSFKAIEREASKQGNINVYLLPQWQTIGF